MANSYLTRTPSSTGNNQKFTISCWLKRSGLGSQEIFTNAYNAQSDNGFLSARFVNDNIELTGWSTTWRVTNAKFRDTSAWYHVVIAIDTTLATAGDRIKIYVNGSQITSFSTSNNPSQNHNFPFNTASFVQDVGCNNYGSGRTQFFNGYISHYAQVDGSQLTPTSFGETDSTSGIWKFKSPSGITWGTNGVHLKFENSGALGTDSSGQSNTYTVGGNLKQALDTPSNVYATLNILTNDGGGAKTYSTGNTTVVESADNWTTAHSTLGVTTGKWYFEGKVTYSNNQEAYLGACSQQTIQDRVNSSHYLGQTTGSVGYYTGNGSYYKGAGAVSYGSAVSGGDIVGVALDLDNNFIYFSINGTWQNSGDPTSGSSGTNGVALPSGMTSGDNIFLSVSPNQSTIQCNFGNGFFGTTAITSAGSNGNGSLFEYDVPSGYYALNTKNINTYG